MKRRQLLTTPRAERDIDENALFIARDDLDAGLHFLDAIEHARDELARHPELGVVRRFGSPRITGLRAWPVPRFENWLIFYRFDQDAVTVIRVLHGKRDLAVILEQ